MDKKIIITSDDFGMSYAVNKGIYSLCKSQHLTTTNIMVPCSWFEHAAMLQRDMESDLGIHLTLTCEWSSYKWRSLTGGKSLLANSGYLHTTIESLMRTATAHDIMNECRAQIEFALKRNLPISYVDLHMCTPSLSPRGFAWNPEYELQLMRTVSLVAKEYNLPYLYELTSEGRLRYLGSTFSITEKQESEIKIYLENLGPGVHHLSSHCAVAADSDQHMALAKDDHYLWAQELRLQDSNVLTSSWFTEYLQNNGIRKCYVRDLMLNANN